MSYLPDHDQGRIKKQNRLSRQERKKRRYKIVHESGRSTKTLWSKIVERSRIKK